MKRKSINHPQLIRLSKIHKKILGETYPNTNELARELETSVITISRDIEFMRDSMGAPICYDAGKRGYFYSESFDMPNYHISDKDVEILAAAKMMLNHFNNTPLYEEACGIIDLLSASVVKNNNSSYINRIAIQPRPQVKYDEEVWKIIWEAIKQNKVLEFDYSGRWNTEISHRRVRPYQLLLDEGFYLFGFSEERNDERLFSLSRIENIKMTESTFDLPEDFMFENRCGGGKFGAYACGEKIKYKIALYREARPLANEIVLAEDEIVKEDKKNERTIVTFSSAQRYKILEWILSLGSGAVPLSPKDFVDEWKECVYWLNDAVQNSIK